MEDQDIPISNEIAQVDTWQPYNFVKFIEDEMSLRGREYQILDLPGDLGVMKTCISYAEKCNRGRYDVVKFVIWALDGTTDPKLTCLKFLPAMLRGYFGTAPESIKAAPRERKEIELSSAMKAWLDDLRTGGNPLGLDLEQK